MTMRLPVDAIQGDLASALRSRQGIVLRAPTGSGKSTRVPQFLLDDLDPPGEIWVLEPRRLAARSLAAWGARQLGEEVGQRVGYRVRFDTRMSASTRVCFLTPGVALRLLHDDPRLARVSCVVFDEFHERGAESDALAACVLRLLAVRADLRTIVMSATLDPEPLLRWFAAAGVSACSLEAQGRAFPVAASHLPPRKLERLDDHVARAVRHLSEGGIEGDILAFLPGLDEIRRASSACAEPAARLGIDIQPLHGDMEPEEQDRVLRPAGRPRLILSTNVAETSLTLPGVRHVVDSGLVRRARHDALRGINTLFTVRASLRSAEQRAGRAGRVAAGTCLRLWDPIDAPPAEDPPEIRRIDLAALWVLLHGLGIDPLALPWIDPPPEDAARMAEDLLRRIGATDGAGLTKTGQALARLPVSPRVGRVLLAARDLGVLERALDWAADWEGEAQARRLRSRLAELLPAIRGARPGGGGPGALARALLSGFPERVAVEIAPGRYTLEGGRTAELDAAALAGEEAAASRRILLALELQETGGRGRDARIRIRSAYALRREWIEEAFPGEVARRDEVAWNPSDRRVVARRTWKFGTLELEGAPLDDAAIDRAAAEETLVGLVEDGTIRLARWDEEVEQWILRCRLVAGWYPERGISTYEGEDRVLCLHEIVSGCLAAGGVEGRDVLPALREFQGGSNCAFIEKMAPLSLTLPNGRKARLRYEEGRPPVLSARIGDLIGVRGGLAVGGGKAPVVWEILAPSYRPVQTTADLDGFWNGSYLEIRKELKRRYPRHPWP